MFEKWLLFMFFMAVWLNVIKTEEVQWNRMRQSDYLVNIHRIEIGWYNHSYFRGLTLDYALYNRTYRTFTGHTQLLKDLDGDMTAHVQLYRMMSNEYRFFPITVSFDLCKELEKNSFGAKTIMLKTTNATVCPGKKGYYYASNAVLDYTRMPPFIPHGDYKMTGKFYHTVNCLGEGSGFFKVSGLPLLPKD